MTKAKRWPRNALWARDDAIKAAEDIDRLGEEVKAAIAEGNLYKARLAVAELQRVVSKEILAKLVAVRASTSCKDCPFWEGKEAQGGQE